MKELLTKPEAAMLLVSSILNIKINDLDRAKKLHPRQAHQWFDPVGGVDIDAILGYRHLAYDFEQDVVRALNFEEIVEGKTVRVFSPQSRQIIFEKYGFNDGDPKSQVQVAKQFGISESAVANSLQRSLPKLYTPPCSPFLIPYLRILGFDIPTDDLKVWRYRRERLPQLLVGIADPQPKGR
jgi:hypothetical protein